jgi:hypothetical protein
MQAGHPTAGRAFVLWSGWVVVIAAAALLGRGTGAPPTPITRGAT